MEFVIYLIALAVGCGVITLIFKKPIWGLYIAIASTAVLKTVSLPVVREKLCATEFIMIFTWVSLFVNGIKENKLSKNKILSTNRSLAITFSTFVLLSGLIAGFGLGGKRAQYTFVETVNYIYGLFIYLTVVVCVRDWKTWKNCLWAWLFGAAIVAIVGTSATVLNSPSWAIEDFTGRVNSTLRNENQVPSFLLPILPVAIVSVAIVKFDKNYKMGLFGLVVLMMLTAFGTGSRTALGMLVLTGLGLYWVWSKERNTKQVQFQLLGSMATFFAVGIIAYFMVALAAFDGNYRLGYTPAWQRPAAMLYEWGSGETVLDGTRPQQVEALMENWYKSPIFGTGPKLAYIKFESAEIHNTYLNVFAEIGIPGFIVFVVWLLHTAVTPLKVLKREPSGISRVLVLALLVGFIVSLFYQCFCFGLRQRNIWIITGLLAVTPALMDDSNRRYRLYLLKKKKGLKGTKELSENVSKTKAIDV